MTLLSAQKCLNHRVREAVARCPQCQHYFCRECITEHEGRVICSRCLADQVVEQPSASSRFSLLRPLIVLGAFTLVWLSFYMLGRTLLVLPDTFHQRAVWHSDSAEASDEE